jgi:hypothetical protein
MRPEGLAPFPEPGPPRTRAPCRPTAGVQGSALPLASHPPALPPMTLRRAGRANSVARALRKASCCLLPASRRTGKGPASGRRALSLESWRRRRAPSRRSRATSPGKRISKQIRAPTDRPAHGKGRLTVSRGQTPSRPSPPPGTPFAPPPEPGGASRARTGSLPPPPVAGPRSDAVPPGSHGSPSPGRSGGSSTRA